MCARFLALDLAAGPCQSGTLKAGEGSVLYTTVPRVEPSFAARKHSHAFYAFVARLARSIALGVSSVLAPDVAVHPRLLTPFAERVVVPVVAFRDHDDFSPFRKVGRSHTRSRGARDLKGTIVTVCLCASRLTGSRVH